MQITLTGITPDQLDELIASIQDKPSLEAIHWQLMGYWMTGSGDDQIPATGNGSIDN